MHDFQATPSFSESPNGIDVGCDFGDCDSIAPLATSFCYLSSVSGNFRGAEEWLQVFPDRNRGLWTLDGHAGSGLLFGSSGSVYGQAQCLLMDQRLSNFSIR